MQTDVVVVGMGAAGLAASLRLAERSRSVIAIDGRDRIGGRVSWQPLPSVDVPAELGAEFIHGSAPETSAFLREAGLGRAEVADETWTCGSAGDLRPADDDEFSGDLFERVATLGADVSVEAFLRCFEDDPAMRRRVALARSFVEGFEAADPARASARAIADEIRSGVDATIARPVGGYAPLFDHLAARCAPAGVDVRLNATVERITWRPGEVTVQTHGAGDAVVRARCAIITVPVGVLRERGTKRLTFAPELPGEKEAALRGLEMGHVVRVVLAFQTPFWEHDAGGRYRDAAFFRCASGAFDVFWTQLPVRDRSIVAWAGGPRATAMAGLTPSERIDRARDAFGALFGAVDLARREFAGGATHDWSADPFSRGAYSYVAAGAGTVRAALGAPVDATLFFAGEATATDGQGGTVSGAFATGLRAADEVARALGPTATPSASMP
jgi:monoamine oxidase